MKKSILPGILVLLLIVACSSQPDEPYNYKQPQAFDDGLVTASLTEVGINKTPLEKAVDKIQTGKYREVHSILIYKDGKLVFEEYFSGHTYRWDAPGHHSQFITWHKDSLHHIMSDSKSITSACVGIAIDKGFIRSVHNPIFDYLPAYQYLRSPEKNKITIEHLLTMTSGLEGREWGSPYADTLNPIINLWLGDDPIKRILNKPMVAEPGSHFEYFGGSQILLGEIIRNASGMAIDSFSREYLFQELGTDQFDWAVRFPNGVIESAGGLRLTPRSMIKFGAMYLNQGEWNGQRIVAEEWVRKSAIPYPGNERINVPGEHSGRNGYGLSWWTNSVSNAGEEVAYFFAGGWGGQVIIVVPEKRSVVVFTGGNYLRAGPHWKIFRKYIVPAFQ